MNYQCPPDLRPDEDLTVDALELFQRFRQTEDLSRVEKLIDEEFNRYLRLCEMAIMYAASADIFWARLPRHPIMDLEVWAAGHLEKKGFIIEYQRNARQEDVPSTYDKKKVLSATIVEAGYIAKWFLAPALDKEAVAAEWHRREMLEDKELKENPPRRQSTGIGEDLKPGEAIWSATLDGQFVVEVQRIFHANYLCIFARDGKLLECEETNVAYGAMFGPDIGDVTAWEERAKQIVDGWTGKPSAT